MQSVSFKKWTKDIYKNSVAKAKLYEEFFESVSCLLVEGPEFHTKLELYDAIKREHDQYIKKLREVR